MKAGSLVGELTVTSSLFTVNLLVVARLLAIRWSREPEGGRSSLLREM
jgi:hypothetical protein